jgi:hypothetical protein
MHEYTIKQNGVTVSSGIANKEDFNAGEPEGLEWGKAYSGKLTKKQEKKAALAALDAECGMPRLLRETLVAIGGATVPQTLKDIEANAATLRGELAAVVE